MVMGHASNIKSSDRKSYARSKEDAADACVSLFFIKLKKKSSHFTKKQSPS